MTISSLFSTATFILLIVCGLVHYVDVEPKPFTKPTLKIVKTSVNKGTIGRDKVQLGRVTFALDAGILY
jgi:hypothetical protein